MVNTSVTWQQAAHTAYSHHLADQHEDTDKNDYLSTTTNVDFVFLEKKSGEYVVGTITTRQRMKAMQKKGREDRKWESNDNPEISDRRVTSVSIRGYY